MKKNAQRAEAKTQDEDSSETVSSEQPQEADVPVMPFDLSSVSPEKIALAEEMGIPIQQIIGWAASVEARFSVIERNLAEAPQKVVAALKAEALKNQREVADRLQKQGINPEQAQGGSVGLAQLLPLLMKEGGSEPNPYMQKMVNAMMEKSMMGMDLSNALTKAMIIKLAPELAESLTSSLVKKG